ncbi:hypothetical protein jhhlp_007550 [Lomentospora prolificans]|uniref:Heterokaryon incompatibility domain-containing protein n=1 Tax=Lomentospora prolificans TaxID=41688 RepID=A0A2N3MZV9_9PEZI|nr:hypothetical protein jhhlp_007550 [Lomentospora prolificans]
MFSWKTFQLNPQFNKDRTSAIPAGIPRRQCAFCSHDIWNTALLRTLSDLRDDQRFEKQYSTPGFRLHESLLAGCQWCVAIGNAVLLSEGITSLDYFFGPRSAYGESELEDDGDADDKASESGKCDWDDNGSSKEADRGKAHWASCTSTAIVRVAFYRDPENSLVNEATVKLGISTSSFQGCPFPSLLEDDDCIRLKFDVSSPEPKSGIFPQDWGIISPTSPRWIEQAKVWLNKCRDHHECASPKLSRPTRLIRLGDRGDAKLVESADLNHFVEYVALSYVWGPSQPYKLVSSNRDELHLQLDSSKLARTIKDAIEVTRALGYGFLWVDALCIMQDSDVDKANELPKMSSIYQGCALTIIAASASSSEEGFLKPLDPLVFYLDPFTVKLHGEQGEISYSIMLGARSVHQNSRETINSRGWTLQERLLSRKSLIFSKASVMWVCGATTRNIGTGPNSVLRPVASIKILRDDSQRLCESDMDIIYRYWLAAREDFGSRVLGFYNDKLPAIGALASLISERTGWTYLAGMWKERLFLDLHWVCGNSDEASLERRPLLMSENARKTGYLAPSWSWASICEGRIVDLELEEFAGAETLRTSYHFKILDVFVDTGRSDTFAFGTVNSGYLLVSGKMFQLKWELLDEEEWGGIMEENISLHGDDGTEENGEILCAGSLDPLDKLPNENEELSLLAVSTGEGAAAQAVDGLILVPAGQDNTFRRAGYFRLLDVSRVPACLNAPTRTLRIV